MKKSRLFVTASLFAALIFVATMFLNVKLPNGYANLGDAFIIAAAFLLGPKYGACAAAIGATLSDICLGYVIYAPATFVIKAVMAILVGSVAAKHKGRMAIFLASLISEIVMVAGYFIYESVLYGMGGAVLSVVGNAVQGLVNIICAYALTIVLRKYLSSYFSSLK